MQKYERLLNFTHQNDKEMTPFIHLHVHSQYSVLDGQASIKALVDKAIDKANENDYNTDVGSSDEGHDISGSSSDDDYTVDENEF